MNYRRPLVSAGKKCKKSYNFCYKSYLSIKHFRISNFTFLFKNNCSECFIHFKSLSFFLQFLSDGIKNQVICMYIKCLAWRNKKKSTKKPTRTISTECIVREKGKKGTCKDEHIHMSVNNKTLRELSLLLHQTSLLLALLLSLRNPTV